MPIKVENPEDGSEIEVFTKEELEAQKQQAIEEAVKPIEEKYSHTTAEYERLQKIHAEQATNFKRLRDMTEEEKSKLTAEQIEARKIAEAALAENEALRASIEADKKAAADAKREALLTHYAGHDKELRAKIEANAGLLSESVPLEQRIEYAAKLSGVAQTINPLTQPFSGEPPRPKTAKDDKEEFLESERAKQALAFMEKLG